MLFLFLITLITTNALELGSSGFSIIFQEKTPDIDFVPNLLDDSVQYRISWNQLVELDENFTQVRSMDFGKNFTYSSNSTIIKDNITIQNTIMTAFIKVDNQNYKFTITHDLYLNNSAAMNVPAGYLKFSIETDDWPFKGEQNSLEITFSMSSTGGNGVGIFKPNNNTIIKIEGSSNHSLSMRVDPQCTVYDKLGVASLKNVSTSVMMPETNTPMRVTLRFPNFSKMSYDPVVGIEFYHSWNPVNPIPGFQFGIVVMFSMCAVFLLMFGLVVVFFNWKNIQKKREGYLMYD